MRSTKNALLRVIPTPTCHSDILSGTLSDSAAPQHRELAEARGGEGGRGGRRKTRRRGRRRRSCTFVKIQRHPHLAGGEWWLHPPLEMGNLVYTQFWNMWSLGHDIFSIRPFLTVIIQSNWMEEQPNHCFVSNLLTCGDLKVIQVIGLVSILEVKIHGYQCGGGLLNFENACALVSS